MSVHFWHNWIYINIKGMVQLVLPGRIQLLYGLQILGTGINGMFTVEVF